MPRFCGIYHCGRTEQRDGGRYFLLPQFLSKGSDLKKQLTVKRRQRWLDVIKRSDITEAGLKYLLVCDLHFITGAPSDIYDVNNPDWAPNQRLGYGTTGCTSDEAMARYQRLKNRKKLRIDPDPDTVEAVDVTGFVGSSTMVRFCGIKNCGKPADQDTSTLDLACFKQVQQRTAYLKNPSNKRISHTEECAVIVNDVFKTDATGKLQFMGYLPGREPRGQTRRKTFKDFIMSREASIAHAKLRETNEKLAVLHKRRLSLLRDKSKFSNLSENSLYPPYESHFINYKDNSSSSSSRKSSFEANVTSENPLNDSEVDDPPVEEICSSDDESSNHSEHLSSEESWRKSPLNCQESSNTSLHQPPEENSSSDESSVDSVSYKNVSSKKSKSDPISALDESNLSSDENSTNLVTFISKLSSPLSSVSSPLSSVSSPKKSQNATENGGHQELLTSLDNNPSGKKSQISSIKSAVSSSNTKLFKFKGSYLERLAKNKKAENSDALLSNSFRREIANVKDKLNERLETAQREKTELREKLRHLQQSTKYYKQKNANLKSLLDQQDVEEDD